LTQFVVVGHELHECPTLVVELGLCEFTFQPHFECLIYIKYILTACTCGGCTAPRAA
jgi:hypothetical protein